MKNTVENSRRNFLKNATIASISATMLPNVGESAANPLQTISIEIENHSEGKLYQPLNIIRIKTQVKSKISISDSTGVIYAKSNKLSEIHEIMLGGTLGLQCITAENNKSNSVGKKIIKLDTHTQLVTSNKTINQLFVDLRWSLVGEWGETSNFRLNNRIYRMFVPWIRDHTHSLKAIKYFNPFIKDGFDFFADTQRADGMVFDNVYTRNQEPNWWEDIMKKGDFIKLLENKKLEVKRQPVEADVEYLFVECLYYSWKATGDSAWMIEKIDHCINALTYSITNNYRWSDTYKLIKRGFTIDTWDFVHEFDFKKTGYGSGQCIDTDFNDFGIMHGDNTGYIASCNYLAEMLETANRKTEAEKWKNTALEFTERLNKTAWNGSFYTHFVPENNNFWSERDTGKTDITKQVSLSNAYALNRNIDHEKATKIIETYLEIKNNLPKGSPGEWYTIFPPFEKGFGNDNDLWQYMNGGVTTIVAGELAKGAFEYGFETYGVDILNRIANLAQKHNGYLNCTFIGANTDVPTQNFQTISLKNIVNADFSGNEAPNILAWTSEGYDNSMFNMPIGNQTFRNIPFEITNPALNNRKGCLMLSHKNGYTQKAILTLNKKTKSIYFLHGCSNANLILTITLSYKDSSNYVDFISEDKCGNWWHPEEKENWKVAFRIPNNKTQNIGMGIYGMKNPFPEKEIATITFETIKKSDSFWFIAGVSLGNQNPYFDKGDVSFGIPDRWGAAACLYGLLEGLAGVQDAGLAFDKVKFLPRWESASENEAKVTLKYEASGGYFTYNYKKSTSNLTITFTGSGKTIEGQLLLPKNTKPTYFKLNEKTLSFQLKTIQNSTYLCFNAAFEGVNTLTIGLV